MIQQLSVHTPTAGGMGWLPGRGPKIPQAIQHSQKKKKKKPHNEEHIPPPSQSHSWHHPRVFETFCAVN